MFYKQHGELQPILLQDDHVEVNLTPEVNAEQVVLTFLRSDGAVIPKVSRQDNSQFQVDSSNISEPIINVQIAAVHTELDIPENDLSTAAFLNRLEQLHMHIQGRLLRIQIPQLQPRSAYSL